MNCKTINEQIKMIDYLAQKNIYPINSKRNIFWFLSPFRNEKTASFKVDISTNRFYDFGEGFGGTLIDLISKLENISTIVLFLFKSKMIFNLKKFKQKMNMKFWN